MADDMARRALEEKKDVVFWNGKVPEDAPGNQVDEAQFTSSSTKRRR